jgi:hypothetical protein
LIAHILSERVRKQRCSSFRRSPLQQPKSKLKNGFHTSVDCRAPLRVSTEAEVTPAMIEAGVSVYLAHCPNSGYEDELDCRMIREIFVAMIQASKPAT